ncbi:MAG TPA: PEGA domain-containing protein, partial [Methanoregula sp.]|nr:PEGA domain-containing protein [Methanoregula sp.]
DSGTITLQNGFTVTSASSAATVTGISPASGTVNSSASVTITGTGFSTSSSKIHLTRSGYNDIVGTVNTYAATQLTGTFDLTGQTSGTYTVCVLYDGTNSACGPTFTINDVTPVNGSISFTSNPSGAGAYLNNVFQATTPYTLGNVTPGTYTVTYKLSGYQDLSQQVTVTAGQTADAYGYLRTNYVYTTAPTPVYTVPPTVRTVATAKKPAITVPTPWPSATPAKSPADLLVVLGAVGIGIAVLRRR